PQQGFGAPPGGGFGAPGQPAFGGGGGMNFVPMIVGGIVAVLGLVALIFTFVDLFDNISDFRKGLDHIAGNDDEARDRVLDERDVFSPGTLTFMVIIVMVGALLTLGGGALLALPGKLKGALQKLGPIAVTAGGALMLVFGIV